MIKDGEDWHRLQPTKLKNLDSIFQTIELLRSSFKGTMLCVMHIYKLL